MAAERAHEVRDLKEAVHGGTQGEVTTAAAGALEQKALLQVEVTLSRAVVFLETWVSVEAGEALEKEVPKRRSHGAVAAEDEEDGDTEGDGEEGDGEGDGTEEPGGGGGGSAPAGGATAGPAAAPGPAGSAPAGEGAGTGPVASETPPSPESK